MISIPEPHVEVLSTVEDDKQQQISILPGTPTESDNDIYDTVCSCVK